jgi:uncharacterized membrane protein YbhN (UPF0104 family)
VGVAAAIALLAVVLPVVAGVPWGRVTDTLGAVPVLWLVVLAVVWFVGLASHTLTLTAAMPGLTARRALALSLTGSCVANLLPLGGAAGVALNYRMARVWGFSGTQVSGYTVVTNAWDLMAKAAVAGLAVPVLVLWPTAWHRGLVEAGGVAALAIVVVGASAGATLASAGAAARVGRLVDVGAGGWSRLRRRPPRPACRDALVRLLGVVASVVGRHRVRLSLGMGLYTTLLLGLFAGCLTATGAGLGFGAIIIGFAVERLLTVVGLTPGGAGVVEVGLTSALLACGGSAVGVLSGVLLYRLFTVGLETPVGALTLAAWWWPRRRRRAG